MLLIQQDFLQVYYLASIFFALASSPFSSIFLASIISSEFFPGIVFFSHSSIMCSGKAPANSFTTSPFINNFTLEISLIPYSAAISWFLSASSLANFHSSLCISASLSSTGPRTLQGPHHSAQKSTRTGILELSSITSFESRKYRNLFFSYVFYS